MILKAREPVLKASVVVLKAGESILGPGEPVLDGDEAVLVSSTTIPVPECASKEVPGARVMEFLGATLLLITATTPSMLAAARFSQVGASCAVSYTHLTLPTTMLV